MAPAGGSGNVSGHRSPSAELLYGLHAVREALRASPRKLRRVLVARQDQHVADIARLARSAGVPLHVEDRQALDRLAPHGRHQGVVAVVASAAYADRDEILAYARTCAEPPFLVILDGIEDPQNLGAVLRSAEAAGAHGVFLPERRTVGLTGTVAKVSAGAVHHLRVAQTPNLSRLIEELQKEGLWIYALDPQAEKRYTALDLRGPLALVFGGEGGGIRPGVLGKCDERASIPMRGQVSSLNVSAAAAIVLFEVVRQRAG
jgi:23S rRNA (guanosine2251-2'-O)-methyltransferase